MDHPQIYHNYEFHSSLLLISFQSPFFDGKQPNWFHFACFWRRANPTDTAEFYGFDSLRWEDQQKITNKLGGENVRP